MNLSNIATCRGMSEPFFFSVDMLDKRKDGRMLAHGIMFNSLILPHDAELKLLNHGRDPRLDHLLKFMWNNFYKEQTQALAAEARKLHADLERKEADLKDLRKQIHDLKIQYDEHNKK